MNKREILACYAYMYEGEWGSIAKAIKNHTEPEEPYLKKEPYITIYDEAYPPALRALRFPPWVLFYRGDLTLLEQPCLTIVGARDLSNYGQLVTELAAEILSERYVLVSGLARGADGIVHRTAIGKGRKTIGVIGCGLNIYYPYQNEYLYHIMERDHLVLSEYPESAMPLKHHFPWRNRILAALGKGLVVTQAKCKSGTMCTVNEALSLGKEVWAFPYLFSDENGEGCNQLISQGANILYNLEQLREMNPLN